ncbi:MAG: hypothetical protein ABIN89_25900 [Chitinophagaceae bacterium]
MKTACLYQNFSRRENVCDSSNLQHFSEKQKKRFTLPVEKKVKVEMISSRSINLF